MIQNVTSIGLFPAVNHLVWKSLLHVTSFPSMVLNSIFLIMPSYSQVIITNFHMGANPLWLRDSSFQLQVYSTERQQVTLFACVSPAEIMSPSQAAVQQAPLLRSGQTFSRDPPLSLSIHHPFVFFPLWRWLAAATSISISSSWHIDTNRQGWRARMCSEYWVTLEGEENVWSIGSEVTL